MLRSETRATLIGARVLIAQVRVALNYPRRGVSAETGQPVGPAVRPVGANQQGWTRRPCRVVLRGSTYHVVVKAAVALRLRQLGVFASDAPFTHQVTLVVDPVTGETTGTSTDVDLTEVEGDA